MATPTNTDATSSATGHSDAASSSPALISINPTAQLPPKLNGTNYPTWRAQFQTLLFGFDLMGYIDGSFPCPPATLTANHVSAPNPAHLPWLRHDSLLCHAILASVEPHIAPSVTRAITAKEAWDKLATTYANTSKTRICGLRNSLVKSTKDSQTITEYMRKIKTISDELALAGSPLSDDELVISALSGLNDDYREISAAIHARDSGISFEELFVKLIDHESFLHREQSRKEPQVITTQFTNKGNSKGKGSGNSNKKNRGFNSGNSGNFYSNKKNHGYNSGNNNWRANQYGNGQWVQCQLCDKKGHVAKNCRSCFPPQFSPQAHFLSRDNNGFNSWVVDSGASHHITPDLQNLSIHSECGGTDGVHLGDGSDITITHTGSTELNSPTSKFVLKNVLCAPALDHNLLSISQFCKDNKASIEFFPNFFDVKDLKTGAVLVQGQSKGNIYEWPINGMSPQAFHVTRSTLDQWHKRMGHPHSRVLRNTVSRFSLPVTKSSLSSCNSCLCNKSHRLPFGDSTVSSTKPLQIIYSDVWGPAPITSFDNSRFYIIFVDHFTRYTWLYPLAKKSDVKQTFIQFKALVERFFNLPILTLYTDGGGEYTALQSVLQQFGIQHLNSPPHMPQIVGLAKHRHRHILETALTLLTQVHMPLKFWSFACQTAIYLINRLVTPNLNNQSPYEILFNVAPNYLAMKTFGCLCYPWLKPYTHHKLEPNSKPCVFLGYSLPHHAYKCLVLASDRIYISSHVVFVEGIFPFANQTSQTPHSRPDLAFWLMPTQIAPTSHRSSLSPGSSSSSSLFSSPTAHFDLPIIRVPATTISSAASSSRVSLNQPPIIGSSSDGLSRDVVPAPPTMSASASTVPSQLILLP